MSSTDEFAPDLCIEIELDSDEELLLYWEAWAALYLDIASYCADPDSSYEVAIEAKLAAFVKLRHLFNSGSRLEVPQIQVLALSGYGFVGLRLGWTLPDNQDINGVVFGRPGLGDNGTHLRKLICITVAANY